VKRWLFALSLGLVAWLLSPSIQATATPEFENQYLKIRISPGWTVAATADQILNLVRRKYLLSIDPIFTHASGIIGGRFAEYASEKQSIKAVMANVDQPAGGFECAEMPADAIVVSENLSLSNLYTDSSKIGNGCVFPSSGRPVWFGSVFSGPGSESDYSITLTYSSNEIDGFPSKDSVELRRVFAEVKEMLKTLQLKPPIVISGIDPESSSPGAKVTIHGRGFHLFNQSVDVRFKEFPNNPTPPPVIAADGNSLAFEVPTSINTISCPPGRIDVNEWCVPTPPNHIDVNDCPPKPNGSANFCGIPMPAGTYQLWVTTGEVGTDFVSLTITSQEETTVSITLLHPNYLVSAGDVVTIHGRGFTVADNTVRIGSAVVTGLSSPDGKTISFCAPAPEGTSFIRGIKIFTAIVTNANGQSNSISFGYR
jgi:IPT/TIG domain